MPPKLIDTMILGSGHSIMVSNSTDKILEVVSKDSGKSLNKTSIEQFGLFGGSNNYHTFYPDVEAKDFNPDQDEFIEPVFRLLSACIVNKSWNPTEFPEDVLKASMPLLIGQTVNCDHETDIANAIGSVKSVSWQESYTVDGITIPAGINGVLKIDGKANPRIARGINMDPPSIHSNSVTVQFEWKPSHNFEHPYEFWDKLGTYDENGELIRRIATRIVSYKETSLVSHGADPFAQKIKDGKIINPVYAQAVNSLSEYQGKPEYKEKLQEEITKRLFSFDFKSIYQMENSEFGTLISTYNTPKPNNEGMENNPKNKSNMNDIQEFLDQLFGENLLTLAEGDKATKELVISQIQSLIAENGTLSQDKQSLTEEVSNLQEEIKQLKEQVSLNEKMATLGTQHLAEVRNSAIVSYKKLVGEEKVDANILALLEADTTNLETLVSLKATYDAQLEEKFPLHCNKCGSKEVSRSSSVQEDPEDEEKFSDSSVVDSLEEIANSKIRNKK